MKRDELLTTTKLSCELHTQSIACTAADATYNLVAGYIRGSYALDYQGELAKFKNAGKLSKTSSLVSYIYVELENSGVIEVEAGNLTLDNELKNTGTVKVIGGSFTVTGATSNSKEIRVEGGALALTGGGSNNLIRVGF